MQPFIWEHDVRVYTYISKKCELNDWNTSGKDNNVVVFNTMQRQYNSMVGQHCLKYLIVKTQDTSAIKIMFSNVKWVSKPDEGASVGIASFNTQFRRLLLDLFSTRQNASVPRSIDDLTINAVYMYIHWISNTYHMWNHNILPACCWIQSCSQHS